MLCSTRWRRKFPIAHIGDSRMEASVAPFRRSAANQGIQYTYVRQQVVSFSRSNRLFHLGQQTNQASLAGLPELLERLRNRVAKAIRRREASTEGTVAKENALRFDTLSIIPLGYKNHGILPVRVKADSHQLNLVHQALYGIGSRRTRMPLRVTETAAPASSSTAVAAITCAKSCAS